MQKELRLSFIKSIFSLCVLFLLFEFTAQLYRYAAESLGSLTFLFGLEELIAALAIFFMVNVPLILVEWISPGTNNQRNYLSGIKYWFIFIIFAHYWSRVVIFIIEKLQITPLFTWVIDKNLSDLSNIGMALIGILLPILIFDFFYYWFHRAQHQFGVLWRFHKVHHSITSLNCINSYHHVFEDIFRLPFVTLPLAFLFKVDAPQLFILSAFVAVWSQYIHSDTSIHLGKLRTVFVDNVYHRIHHSKIPEHFDKNFVAFFPLWDRLFGTYQKPGQSNFPAAGLKTTPPPKSILEYLLMPFQRSGK